ncbi:MAG: response regulator transcription factor [Anaerolinea sp.]|nr:response regulator transcription factor [Anaerolinea sp.]MCC6976236.1 response regulator transcription factor [Anaerolineae bacterium]CAG1010469.1 Response regulator protein VraR [Anaerolineae bacterium]
METIHVLIADDHTLFRDGLRALLTSIAGIEVVGEAASGKEAVRLAVEHQPDVILMDIQMPDLNGIEATRQILRTSPHIGIVVLTMFQDDDSVFAVMRAGARGYVLKGADQGVLLRAVRAVANGESLFSPEIAARLMQFFAGLDPASRPELFPELTEREREILSFIANGHTNAEIAEKLVISMKTVRNHVSNIFSKLQVADRAQAAIRAREAGLGGASPRLSDSGFKGE